MVDELKYLSGVVDRIEADKAVIRLDDGGEIIWPAEKLPAGCAAGSSMKLLALSDADMEAHREGIAKNILKEILKTDD